MEPNYFDTYIHMGDNWDKISTYIITEITDREYVLSGASDYLTMATVRRLALKDRHKLQIYPFSMFNYERYKDLHLFMWRVGDLVCAFLNKEAFLTLESLSDKLMEHETKYKFRDIDIEWTLRCLTAGKIIVPKCKNGIVSFSLSPAYKARESERNFSATIAGELESLSERIRYIIKHGPSVGTYRENLLQNCLKKHLPERYHIATGFILGLPRQIDILIYDSIDYAPVFREGDLVIVPPESVRAVIEVKTEITSSNLKSALGLLDSVCFFDDNQPPFFKGVFAFESALREESFYQEIVSFYTDLEAQSAGAEGEMIRRPFHHLTCICVNQKAFAYIRYNRNNNARLVPVLYSKRSATDLKSQSSFFIQSLLSHLKFGGIKPFKMNYVGRMLGEDTVVQKIKDLREDDDSWGAYFAFDEGDEEEDAVEEMERLITSAQRWIDGEDNFEVISSA